MFNTVQIRMCLDFIFELLFPCVLTSEAERFLKEYNKQHGHFDPFNAKPLTIEGKTYVVKRL